MVGQGRTLLGDRATRSDENSRRACRAASFAISSVSSGDTWLCIFSLRRITTTGQLVQLSGLHTLQNQVPACTDQSLFFESSPRSKGSCQPCTQPHAAHRRHHSRASMPSRRNELKKQIWEFCKPSTVHGDRDPTVPSRNPYKRNQPSHVLTQCMKWLSLLFFIGRTCLCSLYNP